MTRINFDNFVESYITQTQKQTIFFNKERDYFDLYKVNLLKEINTSRPNKILDFGCGIGLCLRFLVKTFKSSKIYAHDESKKSQAFAKKKYHGVYFLNKNQLEKHKYDIIFISGVFHHVQIEKRKKLISKLNRMLNKNGNIFITEHNPYNPITQKIVSECEYDKDAQLLKRKNLFNLLKSNNFSIKNSGYYLFFPEFFKFFRPVEKYLRWLPLGGQYFIFAKKS